MKDPLENHKVRYTHLFCLFSDAVSHNVSVVFTSQPCEKSYCVGFSSRFNPRVVKFGRQRS